MPFLHWCYPCALLPAAHFFQILHRKQTKIPLRKPLQKKQLKTLLTTPPASQTKQPWLQPGKPLTSTRKTCLNRKPPSPFLPFTIHLQTRKVTALPIMTALLELLPLKIHERTLKRQNRSKQTLKLWIPVFYPKTSCLPIPFFLPTLILFCPLMD